MTGSRKKKGRKAVVIEDDEEFEDHEEVWDAVEWGDIGPMDSEAVFDKDILSDILKDAVDQAWEDGTISGDEMAILNVLKSKLKIDDDTFDWIINERRPEDTEEGLELVDEDQEELMEIEEVDEEEEEEIIQGEVLPDTMQYYRKEEMDLTSISVQPPMQEMTPQPKAPEMITLRHSVRGESRPLNQAFDLSKQEAATEKSARITRRCPHCRSLIRLDPEHGKMSCPVCGKRISEDEDTPSEMRKLLDQAKQAYKMGDLEVAEKFYNDIIQEDPGNKEAQFYIQKMKVKTTSVNTSTIDARNISYLDTTSIRVDQLLDGGIKMGDTVLVEGPPFCGKEVLLEQFMASALNKGIPVIYVSTNRAMKEVMRSIIRRVPNFKQYNHQGLIRMYDLFSKFKDDLVLKEGHRIFNIDDREDFQRFQGDLVFVLEELVKIYHGGVLIINSLSPLISQVDQQDLMKFLQVLIARSKSYRFTNILDMAAGVHTESIVNSVEYLMDGIIEFREQDLKNMCRMKGFSQNILTRDWVEYVVKENNIHIVGSFMEERIV